MAKAKKPNDETLRKEAQSRMAQMPAESAGGRLDDSAEMDMDIDLDIDAEQAMREKTGNQPNPRPKR